MAGTLVTSVLESTGTSRPATAAPAVMKSTGAGRTLRTLQAAGRKLDTRDPAVVQQVAGQFLSELFFAPLLAEARQFPLGRELATGGRTEAIFGAQLDQRVADQVAAANPALLKQMTRYFDPHAEHVAPGTDQARWPVSDRIQHGRAGGQT